MNSEYNIYENYSKISANDYADFLAQLLKMEIEHRELVRKNRNLKFAGFDVIKTFEDYEFEDIGYSAVAEPRIRCGVSHLSGIVEPPLISSLSIELFAERFC
jgi:hypothetical protein